MEIWLNYIGSTTKTSHCARIKGGSSLLNFSHGGSMGSFGKTELRSYDVVTETCNKCIQVITIYMFCIPFTVPHKKYYIL